MSNIDIRLSLDPLLKQLEDERSIDVAEKIIAELAGMLGIKVSDRFLLNVPRIDAELSRFMLAPGFGRQAAAYDIPNDYSDFIDLKLFGVKKTTKTNLSWLIGITPNFEDSEANDYKNISIDFIFPESSDRLIILISDKFKIRSLELKDHITQTQFEIFSNWKNIKINEYSDVKDAKALVHSKLWESFNFEPINRAFYLELVESFSLLVHHLEKIFGRKPSVMFTTRLIGRLLFLWFLRKKNYINKQHGYFDVSGADNQDQYYKTKLEILFFEVLNREINQRENGDQITPYLNGGLFDVNQTDFFKDANLTFPVAYFSNLFSTLNKYNFTVDESSPEFQHVAIDPEMLGRIFESLLAEQIDEISGDNKKKVTGAFYTPREIVSFMCEESLIEFLKDKIPDGSDKDLRLQELLRLPETIFRDQDQNKRRDWKPYAESIINALSGSISGKPLTILDPAVGSGAFPMGMLQLLVKVFGRLDTKYEKNISSLKRDILSRSLYGVDVEQTAIEICRLRAWLSIIVDIPEGEKVEPLPNLDFKFTCANTLVSLEDESQATMNFDFGFKDKLMKIRDEYFNASNKSKKLKLQSSYQELTHQEDVFDSKKTQQLKSYKPFDVGASSEFYDPELHHGVKYFDLVIGNPPYVRQEDIKEIKGYLKERFSIFHAKADLLTYFVEQGFNFLKDGGSLNFIISNKFTRTDYGRVMRNFISKKTRILSFIDFEGISVFENATVDAAILNFRKGLPDKSGNMKYFNANSHEDKRNSVDLLLRNKLSDYAVKDLSDDGWTFESPLQLNIKNKFSSKGIPLKDWDIKIFRGILTGLNKAFVVDAETKDKLILEDRSSKELLKPLIRGRDIDRFKVTYSDLWLISTFPNLNIDIDKFPAIKKHLKNFYNELQQSGEKGSRKKTAGKWYEIQDSIAYWREFEEPKIIYPNMTKYMPFYLDLKGYYANQKCFILTGRSIAYLTCLFNSKLFDFCFRENFPLLLGGTRELSKVFFEKIPVKTVTITQNNYLNELLLKIQSNVGKDQAYLELEQQVDIFLYKLYDLPYQDILLIDSRVGFTEKEFLSYILPK
jgi:hypothetical protein